ncbi:MAG: Na+/H+ antiporter subunit E [Thermoplasmatota archaeon]
MGIEHSNQDAYKRHYALLDILLLVFWLILTGTFVSMIHDGTISFLHILLGVVSASIVTYIAHKFVIRGEEREKESIFEYLNSLKNVVLLFIDVIFRLIVANGILMYQSLTLDVEPKIVKVKVNLTSESEVTFISLIISLIPGTFVLDVEELKNDYYLYIHYSYLKADNLSENIKEDISKWDSMIRGIFK